KDDFVKLLLDQYMTHFGYDPIGLEPGGKINATLLQGDYFVGHDYGWPDFKWGIPAYTAADLAADPTGVIARHPVIVSQFGVTPQSDTFSAAIAGTGSRRSPLGCASSFVTRLR